MSAPFPRPSARGGINAAFADSCGDKGSSPLGYKSRVENLQTPGGQSLRSDLVDTRAKEENTFDLIVNDARQTEK